MATTGFIARHQLWTAAQEEAAAELAARLESENIEMIRLSWPDQHGLLRGKSLSRHTFLNALTDGAEITMAPFFFDTANAIAFNPFTPGGGFDIPELGGSPNVIMVPDPTTFTLLPWAERTGWALADLVMRDASPFPFSPRTLLRQVLARLDDAGYRLASGIEIEWYLTKLIDDGLDGDLGAPGAPAPAPTVRAVARGYSYLLENHLDELDDVLGALRHNLLQLGLPLRSIDDEWAPSQIETTFDVIEGIRAADSVVLFRNATKQVTRRMGHHATFMAQPAIPGFYSSGWHLHTSVVDKATGANAFMPTSAGEPLSKVGLQWIAGSLEHAVAGSLFTTPTVNGYRRRRPFSLAPDRATWAIDNRAAMIRVLSGGPDDRASHVENRIGEPAANPYLYLAAQVVAGLDGIERGLDPGSPSVDPYAETDKALLPTTLADAVDSLAGDQFFRTAFGDRFIDYIVAMKRCELSRFDTHVKEQDRPDEYVSNVTEWEHREYFTLF